MSKLLSKFYFIHDSKKSHCTAKSPNPKLTPKFPTSWEKSQAMGALVKTFKNEVASRPTVGLVADRQE